MLKTVISCTVWRRNYWEQKLNTGTEGNKNIKMTTANILMRGKRRRAETNMATVKS